MVLWLNQDFLCGLVLCISFNDVFLCVMVVFDVGYFDGIDGISVCELFQVVCVLELDNDCVLVGLCSVGQVELVQVQKQLVVG